MMCKCGESAVKMRCKRSVASVQMKCKCGESAVQKSVMKMVEMTSEARRSPYPITDRTQEHSAESDVKASQKELIGAIIGFIVRNESELLRGCDRRDWIKMKL